MDSRVRLIKSKAVFVVGTDTGVGKTLITGLLGRYLLEGDYNVVTQKWIQTGSVRPEDIDVHLRLMRRRKQDMRCYLSHMVPYTLKFPASPHLAAILEGKRISARRVKQSFRMLSRDFDFIIVEGTGGALVPFNRRRLVIDIAEELNLPVLIVAQNRLGAINQTLLTVDAVRRRRMRIVGIVFNSQPGRERKAILEDNPKIIKIFTGEKIFGNLPWLEDKDRLYKAFIHIGSGILTQLRREEHSG